MKLKNKKKIKIIALIIVILALVGGIFLISKKWGEKKENSPTEIKKTDQKSDLEKLLVQLERELEKATDSNKKEELENKIKKTKQEIKKLGGSNNNNNNNNNNPSKTQKKFTVRYNTETGGAHEFININNDKERVLIDTKNKTINGKTFISDSQFTISFNEEEVQKHKNGSWLFVPSNDKFQLTPITPSVPGNNNPNSDQVETELSVTFLEPDYLRLSNNLKDGDWRPDSGIEPMFIFISNKNPVWKRINLNEDWKKLPNFKISFLKKDASQREKENTGWGEKNKYYFDENNTKFTLTPLGNWPNDDSHNNNNKNCAFCSKTIDPNNFTLDANNNLYFCDSVCLLNWKQSNENNNPPQNKRITLQLTFVKSLNVNQSYAFTEGKKENGVFVMKQNAKTLFISVRNPAVNKILNEHSEYKISFELDPSGQRIFKTTSVLFLGADEAIEVEEL